MKTILMDLQGTLGGDPIGDITSFEFYPRALDALKLLSDQGYRLVVITNQSRISKGHLSIEMYEMKTKEINAVLSEKKIKNLEFYCCPHTNKDNCMCKKPKIELFKHANEKAPIDLKESFMVGDMGMSDMMFAHHLGIRKILVLTGVGVGSLNEFRSTWSETEADFIAQDIFDAVTWIIKN